MPRPWISIRRSGLLWALAAMVPPQPGSETAVSPAASPWSRAALVAENLVAERFRLAALQGELRRLRFAVEDLRDLQIFPDSVLRLGARDAVEFDRRIVVLDRNINHSEEAGNEIEASLSDAAFVAREMVQETPNRDMMEILLKDHARRIERAAALEGELSAAGGRWDSAHSLILEFRLRCGLDARPPPTAFPGGEGGMAARFHAEIHAVKDSLAARAGSGDYERMARIDLARVETRLKSGTGREERTREWIAGDLDRLTRRFDGRVSIGAGLHFLGEIRLANGQPLAAAEAFARVGSDSRWFTRSRFGILRALFAAGLDDSVIHHYAALKDGVFRSEPFRSPARAFAIQSLYALGRDSLVEFEMLGIGNHQASHQPSLFVYAQSLVRGNRRPEARQVLGGLAGTSASAGIRRRAGMALAHLNYEDGHYEAALRGYQNLLENSAARAEALYGMVWCNIRLGDLGGAEFVLKKLISQHPDAPWAVDGFMVFVRKLMLKAREEWEYRLQVEEQASRLEELEKTSLRERVEMARAALAKASPLAVEGVAALYRQALNLCDFVEARYRTGEYSERGFLDARERVLAKLQEAETATIRAPTRGAPTTGTAVRGKMLRKLSEVRALALDIHWLNKAWLEELLKYTQVRLNREIASHLDSAAGRDPRRARALKAQSRKLADAMSERLAAKSEEILRRIRELSADSGSARLRDGLLFQRGYLLYAQVEEAWKRRLALNHLLDESVPEGNLENRAQDYANYEEPWLELIRHVPASPYAPAALYFLGYARAARGESDLGLGNFEDLTTRFPESPYAQQALIFIGEHYFNENDLVRAERAYDQVLDHPDSRYFDQALYKLAWTRYRASAYKPAISSFTYLLGESQRQTRRKGKSLLTQESLQFAALSLAESDTTGDGGFARSEDFGRRLGDPRIGAQLLHKMAGIYLRQGRLERAKRALESLLRKYPAYEEMPAAMMELAQAFDKERNFARGAEIREGVLRRYGPGSEWYRSLPGSEARAAADSLVERAVDEMSRHYLLEAKRDAASPGEKSAERKSLLYRKAIAGYEGLIAAYPAHPRAARFAYQQAEAYYALEDYAGAARKYLQVSRGGHPKLGVVGAYNAIVAAQELMRKAEGNAGR